MHRVRPESSAGPFQRVMQRRELDDVAQMHRQFNYPAVFQKYHCAVISLRAAEKSCPQQACMAYAKVVLGTGGTLHVSGDTFRGTTEHHFKFGEIRQTRWVVLRRILPIPFEMDAFSKIMSRKQEFENLALICP